MEWFCFNKSGSSSTSRCSWVRRCVKKRGKESATPLPLGKVFVVLTVQFGNVFGSIVLFPFLPFMVQDFFPELSKEELGQKAGYLGSVYFVGSFTGSMIWGWISDTWGRRPALMLGCLGTVFSSLLFGFSQNFATALTARFLWGLLNGNVGVAKTYLSEVLDDSNQGKGFSSFGLSSGLGRILGSVVGGFLSQPASKYSAFEHPFFCKYRYVLPIFVVAAIAGVGFFSSLLFLEETLRKGGQSQQENQSHDSSSSDINSDTDIEMVSLTSESEAELPNGNIDSGTDMMESDMSDTDALLEPHTRVTIQQPFLSRKINLKERLKHVDLSRPFKRFYKMQKEQLRQCCYCFIGEEGQSLRKCTNPRDIPRKCMSRITMMLKLMWDRRVIVSVLTYAFAGGITIMSNEIYPLLLVTDHKHGGYSMDDNEISVFVMSAGVAMLFYQLLIYPKLLKITGYRHMLRISLIVFAVGNFLLPWSNRITGPIEEQGHSLASASGMGSGLPGIGSGMELHDLGFCGFNNSEETVNVNSVKRLPASVWGFLLFVTVLTILARVTCIITTIVLVNNSTLNETRGTVNAIGQTLVALVRSVGPSVGGLLFAWSERNGLQWPLNYHFIFEVCVVVSVAIALFSFLLPKSIELKRTK